jgi:hypothetical protein
MNDLLRGVYDLHIHTAPDVVPRKCSDLEAAQRMLATGMSGGAIKCHYLDTAARAVLLHEQFPQLNIVGGITLNRSVGGLNPSAVERTAQAGGKMLWFPTLEAREYQRYHRPNDPDADLSHYISACDENGHLLPAALDVLDAAAQYQMVVGTGHIGALEGMELVREGQHKGCTMVLTHADNPADQYTIEQQMEAVRLGAVVEHSFFTTYYGRTSIEEIVRQIRAVGCENVILTTDFGQPKSPFFDEGMAQYAHLLLENGFTLDELRQIMCQNPRRILS